MAMIHPSYNEMIEAINSNYEEDDNTMLINSRYSLVLATSKRARQIIAGSEPLVKNADGKKPLSIAIDELYQGKIKILENRQEEEEKETLNIPKTDGLYDLDEEEEKALHDAERESEEEYDEDESEDDDDSQDNAGFEDDYGSES